MPQSKMKSKLCGIPRHKKNNLDKMSKQKKIVKHKLS